MPKRDQRDNTKIHVLVIFALLTMDVNFAALPKGIFKGFVVSFA